MRFKNLGLVLLVALALLSAAVWAQELTGTIVGTVLDPSGAVVPNATVTVKNTDQNLVVRTLTTNESGYYTALNLQPGHYSITVTAGGFKKWVQSSIALNVNDKLSANATLQVGAATEIVEVQASPVEVDLQTPTSSGLINGTQVREMPLNNRAFLQLVTLMPGISNTGGDQFYVGVTNPFGSTNVLGISVNGQRTSSNNWTVDGADNVDRGSNLTLLMMPSVDSIAELRVLRSNYNAEFGRAGGAQVNIVSRSGTSTFHGGLYEFWRNENLNADTYFGKQSNRYYQPSLACENRFFPGQSGVPTPNCDSRQPLRYHDFGGTFGGPLTIPHLFNTNRDKTFFFFSEEMRRVITYSTGSLVALPTSPMLNGTFPVPVCTAFSAAGACTTTGTQVTSISPLASAYIKDIWSKMQLPTDPTNLYERFFFGNIANFREENIKVDHVFGPRLSVYGRYIHDNIPTTEPRGLFGPNSQLPGVGDTQTNSPGWSFIGRSTATFSPNTLLELGYNYSYGAIVSKPTGLMAMKNSPDIKANLPFPVSLDAVPNVSSYYLAGLGTHPRYDDYNRNHQAFSNFTRISGRHNVKFGATYYHYQKTENASGSNIGSFSFRYYGAPAAPAGSGYSATQMNIFQNWANFLMGRAYSFSQANLDMFPDIRQNAWEFFGQDEFRLKKNLTISYGMRYSMFRQPTDASGLLTNFDPKYYDPAKAPQIDPTTGYIINAATSNLLNGVVPSTTSLKSCQNLLSKGQTTYCWASGTTAPFGSKVGAEFNRAFAPRIGFAWDPFGDGKTSVRSGFALFYDVGLFGVVEQNIFSQPPFVQTLSLTGSTTAVIPFDNPTGSLQISSVPKTGQSRIDPNYHTPYTQTWNFGVQRQLTPTALLNVEYVGNRANHILGESDLNQPQVGAYLNYATNLCGAAGCLATGMVSPTRLNAIRPYKGWGPIIAIRTAYMSDYNSLQVSLDKRFKGASQVGIAYTWSHALTDNQTDRSTAPRDTYHPQLEYGPTQQDRRHVFTANFVYELPWLKAQKGIVGHVLGGWEVTGILSAMTGVPLTVFDYATGLDMAGQGCQASATPCSIFPDQLAAGDAVYQYIGQTVNVGSKLGGNWVLDQTKTFGPTYSLWWWFNPNNWASVPAGQVRVGNSRRGAVYGPGMWRQDVSMIKNFKFTERLSGQLRADAFNVFNHTNPSTIDSGFGDYSAANGQTTFGQITNTRDPRIMQLGMKINF